MVNVMSHEEEHCFQWQESGHIACHCPSVQCFECDEYGNIVMDCPHRIPPSGTPAHHQRPKSHSSCYTRSTSHHHHKDRYRCSQSRSQSHPSWYHSKSHHDSYRGHVRSHHRANWWHYRSSSQCPHSTTYTHCSCHDPPHCRSSTHRSSSIYSRDCSGSHSWPACTPTKKASYNSLSHSSKSQGNAHTKRNSRVTIDDLQTD